MGYLYKYITILSNVIFIIGLLCIIRAISFFWINAYKNWAYKEKAAKALRTIYVGFATSILAWLIRPVYADKSLRSRSQDAYVYSIQCIKEKLRIQSTIKFPKYKYGVVKYEGNNLFFVNSYVDYTNNGANIRVYYDGKLKYRGKERWKLLIIKMNNEQIISSVNN